jgi:hypothetical protein
MNYILEYDHFNEIQLNVYTGNDFLKKFFNKINDLYQFKYFSSRGDFQNSDDVYFFTLEKENKIIGLAHIRKSPYLEKTYWLSYLSILKEFENMNYATKLSDYLFNWFSDNELQFETSSYSNEGFVKLKPLFNRLSKKYNVSFIDKETTI